MPIPHYPLYNYPTYGAQRLEQPYMPDNTSQSLASHSFIPGHMSSVQNIQNGFLCRPVTSKEEALAVQTDFMSAGTIMPDLGHETIYLKRFDSNTGLSNLFEFSLVESKEPDSTPKVSEISLPDYSDTFQSFSEKLEELNNRIENIGNKLDTWKVKNISKKGTTEE